MELDEETLAEVEHLKREGEHAAAASALWALGFSREAGQIFETLFEHQNALAAYEEAEDVVSAMRIALLLGEQKAIDRVVTRALKSGKAEILIDALQKGNRLIAIGRIHLVNDDLEAAADAFEAGAAFLDAAKAREAMGDHRTAGLLYERYLETNAHDPEACFRLGRILCRFSRNDDGIALLQQALKSDPRPERFCLCAPHLVLSFERLGYKNAALALLKKWHDAHQQLHPERSDEVPATLEVFLASPYSQSRLIQDEKSQNSVVKKNATKPALSTGFDDFFEQAPSSSVNNNPTSLTQLSSESNSPLEIQEEPENLLAGRYLLGEPLGGGGVGQVFKAFDVFMDKSAAVKIFGKQTLASNAISAYAREARAAASLEHPSITPLIELNLANGFQVTDLIQGDTVEVKLQQGGDSTWLRPMTHALLDLLSTCHRAGLIHGALKPTNLFLIAGGLRVADFGAHHLLTLRSTETGGLSSSWPYLAPEQLFGAPANVQTDLYALAAILYRALTGGAPFTNPQADRRKAPAYATEKNPNLDENWALFLAKALHPQSEKRFHDAADFLKHLPLFPSFALPKANLPEGKIVNTPAAFDEDDRYQKGALVFRSNQDLRVYEGEDKALFRQVWWVESSSEDELLPLIACARVGTGVQPVYDVQQAKKRVIVARDSTRKRRTHNELKQIPQSLSQDFMQLALSIQRLHDEGFAFGGFDFKRAIGPIGPRMRLAPAELPVAATSLQVQNDWACFAKVLQKAFGAELDDVDLIPQKTESLKEASELQELEQEKFIFLLEQTGLLQRTDSDALKLRIKAKNTWPTLLKNVSTRLIAAAPLRVISRLIASVIQNDNKPPQSFANHSHSKPPSF